MGTSLELDNFARVGRPRCRRLQRKLQRKLHRTEAPAVCLGITPVSLGDIQDDAFGGAKQAIDHGMVFVP